jgi:hypothetical protein
MQTRRSARCYPTLLVSLARALRRSLSGAISGRPRAVHSAAIDDDEEDE